MAACAVCDRDLAGEARWVASDASLAGGDVQIPLRALGASSILSRQVGEAARIAICRIARKAVGMDAGVADAAIVVGARRTEWTARPLDS